jgi:hypothetical protein
MFKDLVSLQKCMELIVEREKGYRNALGNLEDGIRPRR